MGNGNTLFWNCMMPGVFLFAPFEEPTRSIHLLWSGWHWPHFQGHRGRYGNSKFNLNGWHVLPLVHVEAPCHAWGHLWSISNWRPKIRSPWPRTSDLEVKVCPMLIQWEDFQMVALLTSFYLEASIHASKNLRSISPWNHKIRSLWPLTYRSKFTFPMLIQWGMETLCFEDVWCRE